MAACIKKAICLFISIFIFDASQITNATAMDFKAQVEPGPATRSGYQFPDRTVIYASGEIVPGDYERFAAIAREAGRDEFGNIRIYYNSLGGNVGEALRLTKLMDFLEVTAMIKEGDTCASACASVLFLSSRIHFVSPGGRIGFHHCKVGKQIDSSLCNELISENAKYHGTPYMSILGAMETKKRLNTDIVYFNGPEACAIALCGPPIADTTIVIPPYDCREAEMIFTKALCLDARLMRYYISTKFYYSILRSSTDETAKFLEQEVDFMARLESCQGEMRCMLTELSVERLAVRSQITLKELVAKFKEVKDTGTRSRAVAVLEECGYRNKCPRPFLLDRTYELFVENMAMSALSLQAEAEAKGVSDYGELETGTLDCFFRTICDPNFKTSNIFNH